MKVNIKKFRYKCIFKTACAYLHKHKPMQALGSSFKYIIATNVFNPDVTSD